MLRLLGSADIKGTKCEAVYSGGTEFYPAVIESLTKNGFVVSFVGYDTTEEVASKDVRPPLSVATTETARAAGASKKSHGEAGGGSGASKSSSSSRGATGGASTADPHTKISITPEMQPSLLDTPEELVRKRKLLKKVSRNNAKIEGEQRVGSWKSFIGGAGGGGDGGVTKKRKKSSLNDVGLPKSSIFSQRDRDSTSAAAAQPPRPSAAPHRAFAFAASKLK